MKEDFLEFFNHVSIITKHSVKSYQKLADQCRVPLNSLKAAFEGTLTMFRGKIPQLRTELLNGEMLSQSL